MANSPERVDSVNALILADRRVSVEVISKQLASSVGTKHKIVLDDFVFFKLSVAVGFYQDNAIPHTAARMETISQLVCEQLSHHPCCSNLVPSDFHSLKDFCVK